MSGHSRLKKTCLVAGEPLESRAMLAASPAPIVALAQDTGGSATDKITRVGTLAVTAAPGAQVEYSINAGKTWSGWFVAKEGANVLQVRQTIPGSGVSAPTPFSFTLDTRAPARPLLSLLADTGASPVDRITRNGTLTCVNPATSRNSLEPGAAVAYAMLQPDGTTWSAWSPSYAPTEGLNTFKVRQVDLAGNESPESMPLTFTRLQVPPVITAVAGPAKRTYTAGAALTFWVAFSRPVVVSPLTGATPALDITIGGVPRKAAYAGGSGTRTLAFSAKVPAGDQGDVAASGTITLPTTGSLPASIRDLAGNAALTSFTPPDLAGVVVDARVPVVTSFRFDMPTKTATLVFSRPVAGVSIGDFRIQGTVSGTTFNLPLTDSQITERIGTVSVAGGGTTWRLTVDRLPTGSGSFMLVLVAAGSGIVDTEVGNPLLTSIGTSLTV